MRSLANSMRACQWDERLSVPPAPPVVSESRIKAIILTQSCDLVLRPDGRTEAEDVILCGFSLKQDLADREQLAQAAGSLISRIGVPKDIAPFTAKKPVAG